MYAGGRRACLPFYGQALWPLQRGGFACSSTPSYHPPPAASSQGNPIVRETRHYRKVVLSTVPRLGYIDDRPVFPLERVATEAWAVGGQAAEAQARRDFEASEKAKVTSQSRSYREWQAGVREKRAAQLAEHNASLAAQGAEPVAALPARSFVSYGAVDQRRVDEQERLSLLVEKAERLARTTGLHGTALMDLGRDYWAGEGSTLPQDGEVADEEDGGAGDEDSQALDSPLSAAAPAADASCPGGAAAAPAVPAQPPAPAAPAPPPLPPAAARAAGRTPEASEEQPPVDEAEDARRRVADSLRLFAEREQRRAAAEAQAALLASSAPPATSAYLDQPTRAAPGTPSSPAPSSSGGGGAAVEWSRAMDSALVQLCTQAAFDFDKVAKALRSAGKP